MKFRGVLTATAQLVFPTGERKLFSFDHCTGDFQCSGARDEGIKEAEIASSMPFEDRCSASHAFARRRQKTVEAV